MKTCDSHVNEIKFVTLPPSYCPRILDLVYDVAEQITGLGTMQILKFRGVENTASGKWSIRDGCLFCVLLGIRGTCVCTR